MRFFLLSAFCLILPTSCLFAAVQIPPYVDPTTARFAPRQGHTGTTPPDPAAILSHLKGELYARIRGDAPHVTEEGPPLYEQLTERWATQLIAASAEEPAEYQKISEHVSEDAIAHLAALIAAQREVSAFLPHCTNAPCRPLYSQSPREEASAFLTHLDIQALTGKDLTAEKIGNLIGHMYRTALLQKLHALQKECADLVRTEFALFSMLE